MKDQIRNEIYGHNFEKPETLYHFVGGTYAASDDVVDSVKANGLVADFGGWSDIDAHLPNRPRGIFFWGEDNAGYNDYNRIEVAVADLDVSKLWAFPNAAAEIANMVECGYDLHDAAIEVMAEAMPVKFEEYDGSFAAEYIYAGDIPAELIK